MSVLQFATLPELTAGGAAACFGLGLVDSAFSLVWVRTLVLGNLETRTTGERRCHTDFSSDALIPVAAAFSCIRFDLRMTGISCSSNFTLNTDTRIAWMWSEGFSAGSGMRRGSSPVPAWMWTMIQLCVVSGTCLVLCLPFCFKGNYIQLACSFSEENVGIGWLHKQKAP